MKRPILALLCTLSLISWGGETITAEQAKTVAQNFVTMDSVGKSVLSDRTVDAVTERGSLWLVTLKPSGYLFVGGNRSAEPIYTFSAEDFAEPAEDSPQKAILERLNALASEADGTIYEARWQRLLGEKTTTLVRRAAFASTAVNIAPLVKSNWGQNYPFYSLAPVIKKSHAPVGCVATAYDQIMRYWEWPEILDADIVTEHSVDSTPGLRWQIQSGTDFEWSSSPYDDTTFDKPTSLRMSRQAIFAGMLAGVSYNTQSGAQTGQPGLNRWYTAYTCLDTSNSTLAEREAGMIASLQAGCPFMVSINTSQGGHAVVGDGWKTSDDGTGWVHLNYGWENTTDASFYSTSSPLGIYLYQKPRPMVLNRPVRTRSTLPVTLAWAFPTKGYETSLKDFVISYTKVADDATDWSDDLSAPKGALDGTLITTATVANWTGGAALRIGTQANEAYYTWPTVVATAATKLTYDVHSDNARGMTVQVQLFDPAAGWTTIDTPELSAAGESEWTTRTIDLAAYTGKGIAVRVYATRSSGSSYVVSDTAGVYFDNVKLTQVREAANAALGETVVDAEKRTAAISDTKLVSGNTYLFTITPRFSDETIVGIPGHAQSCTIADESVAQPTITSVSSVTSSAPTFTDGMQRDAYLGLNQIGVYGSAAMTDLKAELNVKSIVDWGLEEDAAFPGSYITAAKTVSIADVVTVEKKSNGNFLVWVDLSSLSEYVLYSAMVLTLRGYNSVGDICQKDIVLYFNKTGGETRIEVADLPAEGTIAPVTPVEPVVTYYTVTFNANGGTGSTSASYESGAMIGSFPTVTREGYTLDGWYTLSDGGVPVSESQTVTANVTYFALWTKNAPVVVDTYTVTFDSNGGSVTLERAVEKDGAIGALPTLTREGYTLDGWYTAAEGGENISATTTISASVTYYAHWTEVMSGGEEEEEEEPTTGGPNDNGTTRFCHGTTSTSGVYDVTRSGTWNTITPVGYNLIFWWIDRYNEANGSNPSDYQVPSTSSIPDNGSYTMQGYTALLLDTALPTTLKAGATREEYFPTMTYTAADWNGSATGNDRVKAAGRQIYSALANGPIGVKVVYSLSRVYGAVIWGCDYTADGNNKFATAVYITDTTSSTRSDKVVRRELAVCETYDGNFSNVGIKSFNGSNAGVIDSYYPIVGPAGSKTPVMPVTPETKTYVVTFDSNGGSAVTAQSVEEGKTIASLPEPTREGYVFCGWFNGEAQLTNLTEINDDVTYTAKWVAVETPVEPDPGTDPDQDTDPVDPGEDAPIGVASNTSDPGTSYAAEYGYEMYDNYWTARKRAIQQGKQLFILSGASWCSNCAFVKGYLKTLGTTFTDKFVVYYSNHDDSTVSPYFHGGLPQYGAADPRTTDAFTGTLDGTTRTWTSVWTTKSSGIYQQDRGGYDSVRVDTVVNAGRAKDRYEAPTELVIHGLDTLATGHAGNYELYAKFADGTEMPVDYGVTWTVSGSGAVADAKVDGRKVAALTITSGSVVLRATSAFYFTGSKSITVKGADLKNVTGVSITTTEVNLEDDATPQIDAVATMADGSQIPVVGFGDWSAVFKGRIDRADKDLEEDNTSPDISFDENSRLTYAKTADGKLAVCDQKIEVTLELNGQRVTKEITVWGPTKVAPSAWTMISGPRQTLHGVVRLSCTELKYNYGGRILTTKDTYFASFRTVLKFTSGGTQESFLRGLTVISTSSKDETCTVGLAATKVNGKYTGYTPSDPTAASHTETFTNVATGSNVTTLEKGEVPTGFFKAFFPNETDYAALAEKDSDGDGFLNWEEYVLGTDPTRASDAFTLMQGYQHLTAPAANGETMQYKVMYAQRAYRAYYIDAKVNWSDDWTQVAKVSLNNMAEDNVTSFTLLNADYADSARFFKVRAALVQHDFNDATTAPQIAPAMLVAAPSSVIDLSAEKTLPLALSSFDTDATNPGTVYVKVPSTAKDGDVLMTVRAARPLSMAALKPQGLAAGLRLLAEGTAESGYRVVVASTAEHPLVELDDANKVTVQVGSATYDISDAFSKVEQFADGSITYTLDDTKGRKVTIGGEDIPVTPELADDAEKGEVPFELVDGKPTFCVKTIPGLKYQVLHTADLNTGFAAEGAAKSAAGTRTTLSLDSTDAAQGFYRIQVTP